MQISTLCSLCKKDCFISDLESGEVICSNCGLVISEKAIETRAEWRSFEGETNDRIRTGMPSSLAQHDMGLATIIGITNKDARGNSLSSAKRSSIKRLRTWDFRTQYSYADRNLHSAFDLLHRIKSKLGLSDAILEKAAYVYRKACQCRLTRGRSASSVLAAAIYIACREMGAARSLRDIAATSNVKRREIAQSYRLLILNLDLKIPLPDPMKCVIKVANKVRLSEKTKHQALDKMADLMKTQLPAGKAPMSFAASVLYLSCVENGDHITQKDLAAAAGVTEVTIRNRIKDLKKHFHLY